MNNIFSKNIRGVNIANTPQIAGGGSSAPIVGPGGQNPINNNRPIVGPGGQNPLAKTPDAIANAMYGSGSLSASNVHLTGVQQNIQAALNSAAAFNVPNVKSFLETAQYYAKMANGLSGQQRANAMLNAKTALNSAGLALQSMGYGQNHKFSAPNYSVKPVSAPIVYR